MTGAEVVIEPDQSAGTIRVETTVRATDRTGVEMERSPPPRWPRSPLRHRAGLDPAARIDGLRLLAKSGGKSGDYRA